MKAITIKLLSLILSLVLLLSLFAACSGTKETVKQPSATSSGGQSEESAPASAAPIEFTMTYADNPTFPFNPEWLTVTEAQKAVNAKINFEVIPYPDYNEKVTLSLNAGNAPDVLTYIDASKVPFSSFGLNDALVALNKYEKLTPNFIAQRDKFNLGEDVKKLHLADGNLYYLPSLYSSAFYDAGPLIRADLLKKYNLQAPTTYEEMYNVLKVFKQNNPASYPLTTLVEARVLFRMTMPSFGISLGKNSSSGSYVLSYDYGKKEYFAGAISDQFKEYLRYFARLYAEGLIDPEFTNPSDKWTSKLATGKSMATWAYYDQIGGITSSSEISGIEFTMLPPLKGSGGAYHQPKDKTGVGIAFPTSTTKRADFDELVKVVDRLFFDPAMSSLFGQGVKGVTFDEVDGKIKYKDELVNSSDGLYKTLQIKYGIGTDQLQLVWDLPTEMLKYDDNYARINAVVAEMKGVPTIPPVPKFDSKQEEEVALLKAPLADMFEVWANSFITGKKDIDKDWDAYVAEARSKNIDKLLELYNKVLKK